MNRLLITISLALLLSISISAQSSVNVGSAAPMFSTVALDGGRVDLSELRGSVVVVTFWSTKCEICRNEIPTLNKFTDRFDPKKVVFLALTMEHEDRLTNYLRANPFNFQVVPNSFGIVLQYADRDKSGSVEMGFPSFFVIDQQGLVRFKTSGYDRTESVGAAIDRLVTK